jgi:UDP-glucose 4-epimerase
VLIASSEKAIADLGWYPERTDLPVIVEDAWQFTRALGDRAHSAAVSAR